MEKYERAPVQAPRVSGVALRAFVSALENGVTGGMLAAKLTKDSGIDRFRELSAGHHSPLQVPLPLEQNVGAEVAGSVLAQQALEAAAVSRGAALETVSHFAQAYRAQTTDPTQVARKLEGHIEALDAGQNRMGFFISRKPQEVHAQAEASAERHRKGQPLSVLDGVPVVVKDELDLDGFATTLGTAIFTTPAVRDATVVARLKAAGALILGKANMQEIGINPIGLNPHYGACRNPYDRTRLTGGSSSASASTVAAGLAPISIGADGGGSVRIPAALCGVVGLKATFGRISEAGVPPLCWNVGHVGPMGLTVRDVAATYAIIAGRDEADATTWRQSPVNLKGFDERSLKGVRLGVCTPYFEDAEHEVVARCREALRACTEAGAELVEIPPPDLNSILWSHAIIILSEMSTAMLPHTEEDASRFGYDSRTNLALGRHFRATDLVHALRHRTRLTHEYLELMKTVDAVVTPTTATVAPLIPEETLPDGESNLPVVDGLMRFIRVGNLTGFPAISVPAGYGLHGMPVGLQFMARPYEEALLFRLGQAVEARVERRLPREHITVL